MNYSSTLHPDEVELAAYMQQTNSAQHSDISLHLAGCADCRQQVTMMSLLKQNVAGPGVKNCDEKQQQLVDDFIYGQLDDNKKESLKADIKKSPLLLKSVLHSLSQQTENSELVEHQAQAPSSSSAANLINWLHNLTDSWLSIPVTAFATLLLTVLVFQLFGLSGGPHDSITIARYQDDETMRFVEQNNTPGIGFFSSAKQHKEPYQNIKISLKGDQLLELEWQAVNNAGDYNLTLSRYSDGRKIIHDKITTSQTRSTIKLTEVDFNQRFEWTLSGVTTQRKVFIAEGGFVINRKAE